jgi:hypothetical protein
VVQNAARETALNCKRIGLALASLERQKGWTLPQQQLDALNALRTS